MSVRSGEITSSQYQESLKQCSEGQLGSRGSEELGGASPGQGVGQKREGCREKECKKGPQGEDKGQQGRRGGMLVNFRWPLGQQHHREIQEGLAERGGNWGR